MIKPYGMAALGRFEQRLQFCEELYPGLSIGNGQNASNIYGCVIDEHLAGVRWDERTKPRR